MKRCLSLLCLAALLLSLFGCTPATSAASVPETATTVTTAASTTATTAAIETTVPTSAVTTEKTTATQTAATIFTTAATSATAGTTTTDDATTATTRSYTSSSFTTTTKATTTTTTTTTKPATTTTKSTTAAKPTTTTTKPTTTTAKPTTTTTAKPTTTTKPTTSPTGVQGGYSYMQIIPDATFDNGFIVQDWLSGASVGTWDPTEGSTATPSWKIAQWGTKSCLLGNRLDSENNVLTDGRKTVKYDDGVLTTRLDSYTILGNNKYDANSGYTWPHLLIEAAPFKYQSAGSNAVYYTGAADRMVFTLDMRMTYYKNTDYGGPNNCQFVAFFYVYNKKGSGFLWFGVPMFEARDFHAQTSPYYAIDKASNSYIYTIPFNAAYNAFSLGDNFHNAKGIPVASDAWNHYEIDIKPWFAKMADIALDAGIFPGATSVEDLYINGMNMGYEVGSCFDVIIQFKNMRLDSYIAK